MARDEIVLYIILLYGWAKIAHGQYKEYCNGEVFNAQCSPGEVIVMQNATYGRMRIGRCVERPRFTDMEGYLGCSVDALPFLDNLCSNKQTCRIQVTTADIRLTTNCWVELKNHLEVQYTCEKVTSFNCETSEIAINTNTTISSEAFVKCKSASQLISAQPGQQLNISLVDFGWQQGQSSSCAHKYGTLRDTVTSNSKDMCSGNSRQQVLMLSNGHKVQIQTQGGSEKQFLLKIEVLGCGDVTAPDGAWVRREGDELLFGCTSGKHTWTLRCEGNQWIGATGQCGTRVQSVVSENTNYSEQSFWGISPAILAFAACSCLMFLASVIFLLTVCVHATRRSHDSGFHAVPHVMKYAQTNTIGGTTDKTTRSFHCQS